MENRIEADTRQIISVAEDMMGHITAMKQEIQELGESMKGLDSRWDGIASAAFLQNFSMDCETLVQFCETMERYCESTRLAAQYYQGNEASVNDTVFWLKI